MYRIILAKFYNFFATELTRLGISYDMVEGTDGRTWHTESVSLDVDWIWPSSPPHGTSCVKVVLNRGPVGARSRVAAWLFELCDSKMESKLEEVVMKFRAEVTRE